jgi:uncharacterized damage-inducible protein DinB
MSTNPGVSRYKRLLAYEQEANRRVFESLESVPEAGRRQASFERAMTLLPHNQLSRSIWLARLEGRPYEVPKEWFPAWSLEQARLAEEEQNREWEEFLGRLSDQDLPKPVSYTSSEGKPYVRMVDDILTHVFNHSTYHRGQVARLVTESGGKRASTDFIALADLVTQTA